MLYSLNKMIFEIRNEILARKYFYPICFETKLNELIRNEASVSNIVK